MGNARRKIHAEPSEQTIYPWIVYTEPSGITQLIRLCLTHQESDRFRILETYYQDEVESAVKSLVAAIHLRKHMLTLHMLDIDQSAQNCELFKILCPMIPDSRSTSEMLCSTHGTVLTYLGGVRNF
jgi:hypothetical protein